MHEKLPQELKRRGAFCLWKYEEREGTRTKVPYQINGFKGDSANRATFTDFNTAVSHIAGYDGIGIGVFDDICAIDIDHCVENGKLSDMAEDIITRMGSYTEFSPSGTGVRILFKAKLSTYDIERYYINNRNLCLVGIVRAERFCDGIILEVVEEGTVVTWLRRLKELDMEI